MNDFDYQIGFESSAVRIRGEREQRLQSSKRQLPFGHAFLDDCLRSIMPNDLIVIGAATGVGKTELARSIASHNARTGKRVHYFALEAEQREIERRTKYNVLASLVAQYHLRLGRPFNYPDWYRGAFDSQLGDLEQEADQFIEKNLRTLSTYYRGARFNHEDIKRLMLAEQDNTDLIVLDHLHYVDNDDDNENRGVREIVMAIRNSALLADRPVILVVHLRKRNQQSKSLMPTSEDIHGSSDVAKVVTHTVMLASASEQSGVPHRRGISNTLISVVKDRGDGAKHLLALCGFNWETKQYEDTYTLGRDVKGTFDPIDAKHTPYWAMRHEGMASEELFQ